MALQKKTREILAEGLGSRKLAADFEASKGHTFDQKHKAWVEMCFADKKAAKEIMTAMATTGQHLSDRTKKAIRTRMITKAAADDLIALIES